jgi:hypothetical protein
MKTPLLILAILAYPIFTAAQTPVTISANEMRMRIGGTIQSQASVSSDIETRAGFGVRRMRLRWYGDLGHNVKLLMQMEGTGTPAFTDYRADWSVTDRTTIRAGRFVGAQPAAMGLTLHSEIDAIDRAAIGEQWTTATRGGDARDFGVELVHRVREIELRAFLHNGTNAQNITGRIGAPQPSNNISKQHVNISGMVRWLPAAHPNREFGAHVGVNPEAYGTMPRYVEASVHAYWGVKTGSQPTRVKADAILIRRDAPGNPSFTGASLFVGRLLNEDLELFGRAEWLDSFVFNQEARTMGTIGMNRKLGSWNQNLKAAYSIRLSEAASTDPAHVAVVQWQVYF